MAPSPPSQCRLLYGRSLAGKLSPRRAIWAKCLECSCWSPSEAHRCPVKACPRWAYQPAVTAARSASRAQNPSEGEGLGGDLVA